MTKTRGMERDQERQLLRARLKDDHDAAERLKQIASGQVC